MPHDKHDRFAVARRDRLGQPDREPVTGLSRRAFLGGSGMSMAALVLASQGFSASKAVANPVFSSYPFTLGVASGDPASNGVVLWTRLAPDPVNDPSTGGMPPVKVPVRCEIGLDRGFRRVVRRGEIFAVPELAHSVHVEVDGLAPGREYFYRFTAGDEISSVGRTKTLPSPGADLDHLRVCRRFVSVVAGRTLRGVSEHGR